MKIVFTREEVATIIAQEVAGMTDNKTTVNFQAYSDDGFATVTVETDETKASEEPSE